MVLPLHYNIIRYATSISCTTVFFMSLPTAVCLRLGGLDEFSFSLARGGFVFHAAFCGALFLGSIKGGARVRGTL